jgi:uncharacterized membrane protein YeaQ/YmgE (transglycosylase-associated protein family)
MPGPGLFSLAVVGLLAGALARGLVGRRLSTFATLLTGLAGALAGAVAAEALGLAASGSLPALAVAALAGSTLLLSLFALLVRR